MRKTVCKLVESKWVKIQPFRLTLKNGLNNVPQLSIYCFELSLEIAVKPQLERNKRRQWFCRRSNRRQGHQHRKRLQWQWKWYTKSNQGKRHCTYPFEYLVSEQRQDLHHNDQFLFWINYAFVIFKLDNWNHFLPIKIRPKIILFICTIMKLYQNFLLILFSFPLMGYEKSFTKG